MSKFQDLTGQKFGRLTVLERVPDYVDKNNKHRTQWKCQCECEAKTIVIVKAENLKSLDTQSCGCLAREAMIENNKKRHKVNTYDLSGEFGVGWTTNTNNIFYFDIEDYDKIKDYCWHEAVNKYGYHSLVAYDSNTKKYIKMWKILVPYEICDHIDRNPLNCKKENLRSATTVQNAQNRSLKSTNKSGVTGVHWDKKMNKWCASITVDKKRIIIGYFYKKEDAIVSRLKAELKYFQDFAPQKHLFNQYSITKEDVEYE